MILYIPKIGQKLLLTQDWSFNLFNEYRNDKVWEIYSKFLNIPEPKYHESAIVTIPKSSVLTLDRIYIRKGLKEYNSLTFFVKFPPHSEIERVKKSIKYSMTRFWAKLEDCYNIEFEIFEEKQ